MKKGIILVLGTLFVLGSYGQNLLTTTIEDWDNGNWENSGRISYTYASNGNLTNTLIQNWSKNSNSYINQTQQSHIYNSNGNLLQQVFRDWNTVTNSWINLQRRSYTYNGNNQVLTVTVENWNNGNWVNYQQTTSTYDSNGYLIKDSSLTWQGNTWDTFQLMTYSNSFQGHLIRITVQNWDVWSNSWNNISRTYYSYSSTNKVLTSNHENWFSGNWQHTSRTTNTYDNNDYLIREVHEIRDINTNTLVNVKLNRHANNSNGTIHQTIGRLWDSSTNTWVNNLRTTYTYQMITGIDEIRTEANEIHIFPNPSANQINFSTPVNVQLINASGQIVANESNVNTLNIADQASGSYFIVISDNKGQILQRSKVIKE